MSAAWLLQIVANLFFAVVIFVLWQRLRRPPQDDPRLSRGLQLLQSKIVVLEDLSDRTDAQVKQLTQILEQKARLLQNKIIEAEHQVQRVESTIVKSKEVAEIFQDKIPHQEILERQSTIKYVKAAQLAHSGKSPQEIAHEVDLPLAQVEMIAKVNRDQLRFDQEALPEWAKSPETKVDFNLNSADLLEDDAKTFSQEVLTQAGANDPAAGSLDSLKKIGEDFRQAVKDYESQHAQLEPRASAPAASRSEIKRVEFPRINLHRNLT